jgi:hypothetical protein
MIQGGKEMAPLWGVRAKLAARDALDQNYLRIYLFISVIR